MEATGIGVDGIRLGGALSDRIWDSVQPTGFIQHEIDATRICFSFYLYSTVGVILPTSVIQVFFHLYIPTVPLYCDFNVGYTCSSNPLTYWCNTLIYMQVYTWVYYLHVCICRPILVRWSMTNLFLELSVCEGLFRIGDWTVMDDSILIPSTRENMPVHSVITCVHLSIHKPTEFPARYLL